MPPLPETRQRRQYPLLLLGRRSGRSSGGFGGLGRRHFGTGFRCSGVFFLATGMLGDDDRQIMLFAELQRRQRDAFRQFQRRYVHDVAGGQGRQVDLDEFR